MPTPTTEARARRFITARVRAGTVSPHQLGTALGIAPATAFAHLEALRAEGHVVKANRHAYRWREG